MIQLLNASLVLHYFFKRIFVSDEQLDWLNTTTTNI